MAVLLAVLAFTGTGERGMAETERTVLIEGLKFQPATLTVKQGETVIWRNVDFMPHNATADRGEFGSKEIAPNSSWKYTANKKGAFSYTCTLHPSMKGTLIVK